LIEYFSSAVYESWIAEELKVVRNVHSAFHLPGGAATGMLHSALSCFVTKGAEPWTLRNTVRDADKTRPANECSEISYPKPDGVLSFDLLTNLQKSGWSSKFKSVFVETDM
jgi:electron-transferring-flavoprotein dehydrogenase